MCRIRGKFIYGRSDAKKDGQVLLMLLVLRMSPVMC